MHKPDPEQIRNGTAALAPDRAESSSSVEDDRHTAKLIAGTLAAVGAAMANALRWVGTERMMRKAEEGGAGNNAAGGLG